MTVRANPVIRMVPSAADRLDIGHVRPPKSEGRRTHSQSSSKGCQGKPSPHLARTSHHHKGGEHDRGTHLRRHRRRQGSGGCRHPPGGPALERVIRRSGSGGTGCRAAGTGAGRGDTGGHRRLGATFGGGRGGGSVTRCGGQSPPSTRFRQVHRPTRQERQAGRSLSTIEPPTWHTLPPPFTPTVAASGVLSKGV